MTRITPGTNKGPRLPSHFARSPATSVGSPRDVLRLGAEEKNGHLGSAKGQCRRAAPISVRKLLSRLFAVRRDR